jgi:hypothetical protein
MPRGSGAGIFSLAHRWITHLAIRSAAPMGLDDNWKFDSSLIPHDECNPKFVYVVDCAIRFNVFAVSDECLRQGIPPEPVLKSIKVRRDFTPYQLLATVREIMQAPTPSYIYFFLSPCKQFFDGDVREEEARFLLRKLIRDFEEMNRRRIPLVLVERPAYQHPVFQEFFPKICSLAQFVWKVQVHEHRDIVGAKKVFQII